MRNPDTYLGIFGHAKHGKSTLAGRMLVELNALDTNEIKKLQKEVDLLKKDKKDFNIYNLAFLKRQSNVEIDHSRTVFPERGNVTLPNKKVITIVDTPGHDAYIDNTIYGAYLSDLAIVTIEASEEIEKGTINVFRLLKSFQIPVAAIAITKMDIVGYSEVFYEKKCEQIRNEVFRNDENSILEIPIIPVDAISETESGIKSKNNLEWYKGKTIIESIENINSKYSPPNELTRFVVEGRKEVFNVDGPGTILVGMLESGSLSLHDKIYLQANAENDNSDFVFTIKSMELAKPVNKVSQDERRIEVANARSIISIGIANSNKIDIKKVLRSGGVFTNEKKLPKKSISIEADISFFEPQKVYLGREYILNANTCNTKATITDTNASNIVSVYRRSTSDLQSAYDFSSEVVQKVNMSFKSPVWIEENPDFQRMTRFLLKENNKIVACGRCTKILS